MADKSLTSLLVDIRAGTAELQRDMDKAVGILQRSGGIMSGIMRGVSEGMGQALGRDVFQMAGKLAGTLNTLADAGNKAGAVADTFQKIGGSSDAVERASKAVMGTVSAFDLMRVANQGVIRGLPDMNKNLALLAEYANRFADASGRDTVEVMNALTQAIGSGSNKALQEFGVTVDKGASQSEKMAQAIDQMRGNMEKLVAPAESVTSAHQAFRVSMGDALKTIGIGINENQQLAGVYRTLADEIKKIDWKQVGSDIASMAASISSVLPSMKTVAAEVNNIALGLRYLTGNLTPMERNLKRIADLQGQIALVEKSQANPFAKWLGGETQAKGLENLRRQLEQARHAARELKNADDLDAFMSKPEAQPKPIQPTNPLAAFGDSSLGSGASRAAMEIDRIRERWAETTARIRQDSLKDAIDESIKGLDVQGFEDLKQKLSKEVYQGFIDGNRDALRAGVSQGELEEQARKAAEAQVRTYEERMGDALQKEAQTRSRLASDQLQAEYEARQRQLRDTAQAAESILGSLFSAMDIDPSLARGAGVFVTNVGEGLFKFFEDNKDAFADIGVGIAEGIGEALNAMFGDSSSSSSSSGGGGGGWLSDLTDVFGGSSSGTLGDGMSTEQAHSSGIQGPGGQDGSFNSGGQSSFSQGNTAGGYASAAQAGVRLYGAWTNRDDIDKKYGDNRGTGAAYGGTAGAAIGYYFGGAQGAAYGEQIGEAFGGFVGKMFGRGPSHPETIARHVFASWMEDQLEEMGGFDVRQSDGSFSKLTNFVEGGRKRFNDPDWAENLTKQSAQVQRTFLGLGTAFKDVLGITEDVGDQIGFLLGENLQYNIDNARHLVQRLGLSFEDIEEKLVDTGLKGTKTWLEVETQLQGVAEAFKPGLAAVGDFNQAFQNTLNSGARGFEAVQGVRDTFVEAQEAGLQTFAQLREELLKTFDPETVNSFFAALDQRGVTTIQAGVDLTDRQAGGVVADMQALGVKFQDAGGHVADSMADLNSATSSNTQATIDNTSALKGLGSINIQYPASPDEGEEAMAAGGVAFGPKRVLMGEAGPEAVLPLTRKDGRLGVSLHGVQGGGGGYVVNIDARGAAPGVERRLQAAIRDQERRISRSIFRHLNR